MLAPQIVVGERMAGFGGSSRRSTNEERSARSSLPRRWLLVGIHRGESEKRAGSRRRLKNIEPIDAAA